MRSSNHWRQSSPTAKRVCALLRSRRPIWTRSRTRWAKSSATAGAPAKCSNVSARCQRTPRRNEGRWMSTTRSRKCWLVRIVYIVDDDAALLGSLERTFRAAGLTAVSYQTAFAFLDAAPDLSDGCLLLDIVMPEMDGLELQERLNSLGFNMPANDMTEWGAM